MSERRFAKAALLALVLAVAGMSWHDLHRETVEDTSVVSGYYAATDATPVSIPDDSQPVIILQGSFAGGRFTHQGLEPFTLAQRQVNLLFRLDAASLHAPAPVLAQMDKTLKGWGDKGSSVAILFLEAPAGEALTGFIAALRRHFEQDPHTVIPVAPAAGNIETASAVAYRLDTAALPGGFMDKIARAHRPFMLILPPGTEEAAIDGRALRKDRLYLGGYVTIDPAAPPVRQEHHIGLWPAF